MNDAFHGQARSALALAAAATAAAATMLALDVTWLGVIARGLYDSMLGSLKRTEVFWPAAALFYATYIGAVVVHAVIGASSPTSALRRGAALGLVTYATYDLTNWAVVTGWPALLVPVDVAWGIALTSVVALVGKFAHTRVLRSRR
ncbi:MAG: DUF2177 family protein [Deltaproteobacteria bacterium]